MKSYTQANTQVLEIQESIRKGEMELAEKQHNEFIKAQNQKNIDSLSQYLVTGRRFVDLGGQRSNGSISIYINQGSLLEQDLIALLNKHNI